MTEKPKYLTLEFWVGIISAVALLAVTLGVITQDEASTWVEMLIGLVSAVLPIIILITGYGAVRAVLVRQGVQSEDVPAWQTLEFWMTLVTTVTMILVAAGVFTQDEATRWVNALGPLVASVLTITAYIRSRMEIASGALDKRLSKQK